MAKNVSVLEIGERLLQHSGTFALYKGAIEVSEQQGATEFKQPNLLSPRCARKSASRKPLSPTFAA